MQLGVKDRAQALRGGSGRACCKRAVLLPPSVRRSEQKKLGSWDATENRDYDCEAAVAVRVAQGGGWYASTVGPSATFYIWGHYVPMDSPGSVRKFWYRRSRQAKAKLLVDPIEGGPAAPAAALPPGDH